MSVYESPKTAKVLKRRCERLAVELSSPLENELERKDASINAARNVKDICMIIAKLTKQKFTSKVLHLVLHFIGIEHGSNCYQERERPITRARPGHEPRRRSRGHRIQVNGRDKGQAIYWNETGGALLRSPACSSNGLQERPCKRFGSCPAVRHRSQ